MRKGDVEDVIAFVIRAMISQKREGLVESLRQAQSVNEARKQAEAAEGSGEDSGMGVRLKVDVGRLKNGAVGAGAKARVERRPRRGNGESERSGVARKGGMRQSEAHSKNSVMPVDMIVNPCQLWRKIGVFRVFFCDFS